MPRFCRSRAASASALTVGFRSSSATVTSDRNGSSSWFSAGTAECVKTVLRSGSIPAAS
jgi:hypothetical protein